MSYAILNLDPDGHETDVDWAVRQEIWYDPAETYIYRLRDGMTGGWSEWCTEWEVFEDDPEFPRAARHALDSVLAGS
jgi:hypothetical protein